MNTADTAKFNMVEQQIRPWEVLDNQVLSVLSQLDRVDFVRDPYKGLAYADCQIPIAKGISMLPPRIEGRMLQALLLKPTDQVLQVGCGSGYLTACLAQLAERVISIDNNAEIIDFARSNVAGCGQDQVEFKQLGLTQLDSSTDYDAIAVSGSMANVPQALKQILKSGGRMFIVVGESPVMQALLITRVGDSEWTQQSLFETDLPRLNP